MIFRPPTTTIPVRVLNIFFFLRFNKPILNTHTHTKCSETKIIKNIEKVWQEKRNKQFGKQDEKSSSHQTEQTNKQT